MLRRALLALSLVAVLVGAGGVAVARTSPSLTTSGATSVTGTDATAVFTIADRTVRQVRYVDGGTLAYTFRVTNDGRLPITLHGLAEQQPRTRLFTYVDLTGADGASSVHLGADETAELTLSLLMGGCESLSARAGAFVTEVAAVVETAGVFSDDLIITLPEELHTGSPREAFCPESTATSRPQG